MRGFPLQQGKQRLSVDSQGMNNVMWILLSFNNEMFRKWDETLKRIYTPTAQMHEYTMPQSTERVEMYSQKALISCTRCPVVLKGSLIYHCGLSWCSVTCGQLYGICGYTLGYNTNRHAKCYLLRWGLMGAVRDNRQSVSIARNHSHFCIRKTKHSNTDVKAFSMWLPNFQS